MNPSRLWSLSLLALAFALIARWSVAWRHLDDMTHAWAAPLLAALLAWERARAPRHPRPDVPIQGTETRRGLLAPLFAAIAGGVYLAARFALESFPVWPAALWLFSLAGWTLAWVALETGLGGRGARRLVFPLLFTAVGLPWLTILDVNIVLPLREGVASLAAEVVDILGYPAHADGAVIALARGRVGVDEACSGVRSLQALLMMALFFGDFFRFRGGRRLALLGAGVAIALVTNFVRAVVLAWKVALDGGDAAEAWHDPAALAQLVAALGGLALVAWLWRGHGRPVSAREPTPSRDLPRLRRTRFAGGALLAWVLLVETAVWAWFAPRDPTAAASTWSLHLPRGSADYSEERLSETVYTLLRADDVRSASWRNPAGKRRAGYLIDWQRGEIARDVIALHKPEICLPLQGHRLVRARELLPGTDRLPPVFLSEFVRGEDRLFVFHSAWDRVRGTPLEEAAEGSTAVWWKRRFGEIAARRSRFSASAFALALWDEPDREAAIDAFRREFTSMQEPEPDARP